MKNRHHKILISLFGLIVSLTPLKASAESLSPPDFKEDIVFEFDRFSAPLSYEALNSMITIPKGVYKIGRPDGPKDESPVHDISLQSFKIDLTEVTNAQFAEFLNALKLEIADDFQSGDASLNQALPPDFIKLVTEGPRGSGLYPIIALDDNEARIDYERGRFIARFRFENHPVAETTWAGARAYCIWRGGRLPTEVEWEAAARGTDERLYPWGNKKPNSALAFMSKRSGATGPVGQLPLGASPFGVLDMSGSMGEWTSSLKRPYPYKSDDGREDPKLPGERVTRGGDYIFDTEIDTMTVTHRDGFSNAPERGHRHIGFRCVDDI